MACSLAVWAKGPRTRKAVGKHGAQETSSSGSVEWVLSEVLLLSDERCGRILTVDRMVEMAGVWSKNASTTLIPKTHHLRKTRLRSPCCNRMEGKTPVNRLLRICGRCGKGGMRDVDGNGKGEPEQVEPLLRWWT